MAGGGVLMWKGWEYPSFTSIFLRVKRKSLLTLSQLEIVNVWSMEDNSVI